MSLWNLGSFIRRTGKSATKGGQENLEEIVERPDIFPGAVANAQEFVVLNFNRTESDTDGFARAGAPEDHLAVNAFESVAANQCEQFAKRFLVQLVFPAAVLRTFQPAHLFPEGAIV